MIQEISQEIVTTDSRMDSIIELLEELNDQIYDAMKNNDPSEKD